MTATRQNKSIPHAAPAGRVTRERRRRDRAIIQLWRDGWTAKKIIIHLGITSAIVGNVVHERGAARNTRPSPRAGGAVVADEVAEAYRVYFWRVMDSLFRQMDEHSGACPRFITIPESADDYQREHITQTIEWWAGQAFKLPTIEIRIEQRQRVQ